MNIRDLNPNSYNVVQRPQTLNINNLPQGSYGVVSQINQSIENKPFTFDVQQSTPQRTPAINAQIKTRMDASYQKSKKESDYANSPIGFAKNFLQSAGSQIASSEIGLGQTLGKAFGNPVLLKEHANTVNRLTNDNIRILRTIKDQEAKGVDTTKLKQIYNSNVKMIGGSNQEINQLNQELPTDTQALGQVGGTALDALTAGTYGKAAQGMKSLQLGGRTSAVKNVATAVSPELGKLSEQTASGLFTKTGLKNIGKGAGIGYGYDVSQNLQAGKEGGEALKPGIGTLIGAGLPGITETTKSIQNTIQRNRNNAIKEIDNLIGRVVQGDIADIPKAKKALSNVDLTGIKTYQNLGQVLNTKIKTISEKLDTVLGINKEAKTLNNLSVSTKIGNETVSHNYVSDALSHLRELYKKTNDPVSVSKIEQMITKAKSQGLTVQELNSLAKNYGNEFGGKAFSKMGDPLTSVNAQSFENTRTGVKQTARTLFDNPVYESADEELTNLIKTRDLVKTMSEKVNDLKQRITERSLGEKAGRLAFNLLDLMSGHFVSGALRAGLTPRGGGLKILNALDLEKMLQKNLKQIDGILQTGASENSIIQKLETILNQSSKELPINQNINKTIKTAKSIPILKSIAKTGENVKSKSISLLKKTKARKQANKKSLFPKTNENK